jgi:dihydroorotase
MKILIKSAQIIEPGSKHSGKKQDILIKGGIISKISDSIKEEADHLIASEDLHISNGWFDCKVNFCDPGLEIKEDLDSGLKSAEAGGMTAVATLPNTIPAVSNKSQVEYLLKKSSQSGVNIHPMGAITEGLKGEQLSEMYDMQQSGAVAFTDGYHDLSAGLLYRALLYTKNFDGKTVSFPFDQTLFGKGYVNEGKISVKTGLKSIPSISEYIRIERDLSLVEYTNGSLHFTGISTAEGVELIRKAKKKGLNVSCDTHVLNLIFDENEMLAFDSNFKILPPLRTVADRIALIEGIKDGTIDAVCSNHNPQNIENKDLEFDLADFGAIGTQSLFSTLNSVENLDLETKVKCISSNPRAIFGVNTSGIEEGQRANITMFNPNTEITYTKESLHSKSKNTPIIDKPLKGTVIGTINKGILTLLD